MNSIQISIEANENQQEILISELSELGAEGFEQTGQYLIAYFNEFGFQSYELNALLKPFVFHTTSLKEQNWNEVWESNFSPVQVEDFCAVRAEFHPPAKDVAHEIIITPKMSFGTGHHATTWMMIRQMKEIDFRNKSVFDFGTGTGILSILAEKLGATSVHAIDIDPWSVANAEENAGRNGCSRISISLSAEIPNRPFDIVLANINRTVILEHLAQLKTITNEKLLLSGLLETDEPDIMSALRTCGFRLLERMEKDNWISLLTENEQKVKLT